MQMKNCKIFLENCQIDRNLDNQKPTENQLSKI